MRETLVECPSDPLHRLISERQESVSSSHLLLVLRCEASHVPRGGAGGGAGVRGGSGARIRGSSRGMGTRGGTTKTPTRLQAG